VNLSPFCVREFATRGYPFFFPPGTGWCRRIIFCYRYPRLHTPTCPNVPSAGTCHDWRKFFFFPSSPGPGDFPRYFFCPRQGRSPIPSDLIWKHVSMPARGLFSRSRSGKGCVPGWTSFCTNMILYRPSFLDEELGVGAIPGPTDLAQRLWPRFPLWQFSHTFPFKFASLFQATRDLRHGTVQVMVRRSVLCQSFTQPDGVIF